MSSQLELSSALQTTAPFKLRRIAFVPAQQSDAVPVPQGLDLVVLNERQPQPSNVSPCVPPCFPLFETPVCAARTQRPACSRRLPPPMVCIAHWRRGRCTHTLSSEGVQRDRMQYPRDQAPGNLVADAFRMCRAYDITDRAQAVPISCSITTSVVANASGRQGAAVLSRK